MNATRLLQPEVALSAITMDNREDLLLPSGNNSNFEPHAPKSFAFFLDQ